MNGSSPQKRPAATLRDIVEGVENYLEHERDEGRMTVEVSPETVADLTKLEVATVSDSGDGDSGLKAVAQQVSACKKCALHSTRTNAVPGQGNSRPEIMFIGEAPGADEDEQGLAFIGAAGKLLTRMIKAMGLTREEVFIGNILKCRPPDNRTPLPEEMAACLPYLEAQLDLLKPRVIVALGGTAVKGLLDITTGITKIRGKWLSFRGIDLMPTFHPAYLLRAQSAKRYVWEDLQAVLKRLGRKPPKRKAP